MMHSFRNAVSVGSIVIIIAAGLLALASKTNLLGGYRFYAVLTGSMEPALPVNSLITIKNESNPSIEDIITFRQPGSPNVLITHRITEALIANGITSYRTKGDANPTPDAWTIRKDQILGRVLFDIPYIGIVINFLNTKLGIVTLVVLPIMLLAYQDIYTLQKGIEDWRTEKKTMLKKISA